MLWSSILLLGVAQLCASKVLSRRWDNVAEKHSWVEIPKGWQHKEHASPNHIFDMRIGLKQHGIEELIENLMEISEPTHPRSVPIIHKIVQRLIYSKKIHPTLDEGTG